MKNKSTAGSFGRLRHKDRPSHSWEREASRISKSTSTFGPLDGGGKTGMAERGHDETRAKHKDLFSRETGNLKAGQADREK